MARKPKVIWTVFILAALAIVVGCFVGAWMFIESTRDAIELHYWKQGLRDGLKTREEAREKYGPEVDKWPGPTVPPS
ncbi:MAG: hypothetical protein AB7G28_14150 [Pirellulales bacterium]